MENRTKKENKEEVYTVDIFRLLGLLVLVALTEFVSMYQALGNEDSPITAILWVLVFIIMTLLSLKKETK